MLSQVQCRPRELGRPPENARAADAISSAYTTSPLSTHSQNLNPGAGSEQPQSPLYTPALHHELDMPNDLCFDYTGLKSAISYQGTPYNMVTHSCKRMYYSYSGPGTWFASSIRSQHYLSVLQSGSGGEFSS